MLSGFQLLIKPDGPGDAQSFGAFEKCLQIPGIPAEMKEYPILFDFASVVAAKRLTAERAVLGSILPAGKIRALRGDEGPISSQTSRSFQGRR